MTNYTLGHDAEKAAASYLSRNNYKILKLNWSTRYCEIDIIASKNKIIYFVEVKYRTTTDYGDGLDYVTDKKLDQMKFAAELWVYQNAWTGPYQLAVIAISGQKYENIKFLPDLY